MGKTNSRATIQLVSPKRRAQRLLPPDHDGGNDQRAAWGKWIMEAYHELTFTDPSCSLSYLLSDLMHMSGRDPDFESFKEALDRAERFYEEVTSANNAS